MTDAVTVRTVGLDQATTPLRIGVLVSATGANLRTLLDMAAADPDTYEVALVASHAPGVPAIDVARSAGVPAWPGDFDDYCGLSSQASTDADRARYRTRAREWHDRLNARIGAWEAVHGRLDLIVLAYHRWIEGDLLQRFAGRMINQHPGDLSLLGSAGERLLIGKDPVRLAMKLGHRSTRTSCFLVDGTRDGGAVLCLGPSVPVEDRRPTAAEAHEQEMRQKAASDQVALRWTVRAIAEKRLAIDTAATHRDGSPVVLIDGTPTPLGGRRFGL
ncbi:Methionyl-tRNA formyltransferase [Actinoplanes sp. SE50]|uniref:formyltransferase family protein n=1 Tax=unclassified Actinoplanes TaxID=2626549 RepID=UPI00023ECA20|nr:MULTISPECIES: formyltransferase family protein [unclassified Actinoplanes]AEV87111.1 Methionyl-tRNA formyltransferase [Actinoplanes sp. SE50/110]ATO85509.1 Methionyl-tRNA formyltransferase [Actinoplanes sp. SE50]SLM02921.1 methionyl-tRNA formyltransferase [Actinoplanes sp. SE50/110]